ncbi:ABC transporter transmembrane domain-containing protein [Jannaschia aquimarina]|uniref:ApxIB_1 protein n=1 Tax=Jannaschia aquimarina TaxID=935700 RepID=A0A0D1CR37_9RHOB|nr:ABC transporter transmembrane domain-containing protein [Jannaschia aquimarina]KIT17237.1 Toxin RTX-I translocation ATP-binding protein [Jannaschia aquimarina]SNT18916.1 ATP-binding cassette, subfamily C, LapB [Jannaschia aquimarina]
MIGTDVKKTAARPLRSASIRAAAENLLALVTQAGWFASLGQISTAMRTDGPDISGPDIAATLDRLDIPFERHPIDAKTAMEGPFPFLLVEADGTSHFVVDSHRDLGLRVGATGHRPARWIGLPQGPLLRVSITPADDAERTEEATSVAATLLGMLPHVWPMLLIAVLVNALGLITPLFVMTVYDTALPARSVETLSALAVGLGLAYAIEIIARRIRRGAIVHLVSEFEDRMGLALLRKMISLPLSTLNRTAASVLQARLRRFEGIRDAFSGPLAQAALDLPSLPVFGAVLFLIAPGIGWIALTCGVVSLLILLMIAPAQRRRDAALSKALESYRQNVEEAIEKQVEMRHEAMRDTKRAELDVGLERYLDADRSARALRQLTAFGLQALLMVSGIGACYLATRYAVQGELRLGVLVAILILVWRFLTPVQMLTSATQQAVSVAEGIRTIDGLLSLPQEKQRGVSPLPPVDIAPPIQLEQVTLRFPETAMPALLGVSLEVQAGQIIVVSGRTMSGKTCLAELVAGLHQPSAGRVLMAGRMIRQVPVDDLRERIAFCPQMPQAFPGTLRQNLRFASPLATEDELRAALGEAGVLDEIDSLPDGLSTELGRGLDPVLPDAMRHKISLAMTFLRPGPVFIFDSPTAGLAPAPAETVRTAIRRRADKGGAVLLISNDPEDLELGDRFVVLSRGRIVLNERGARGRSRVAALLDPGGHR